MVVNLALDVDKSGHFHSKTGDANFFRTCSSNFSNQKRALPCLFAQERSVPWALQINYSLVWNAVIISLASLWNVGILQKFCRKKK